MKHKLEINPFTNSANKSESPLWLIKFIDNYNNLSTDNLASIKNIYHEEVVFIDPLHQVKGLCNLQHYFYGLYMNLVSCNFTIEHVFQNDNEAAVYWQMSYQHTKLNSGEVVNVQGHSHIKGENDKVIYHRDYFDAGAVLYEHIPLLGRIIKWVKAGASK